MKERRDKDREIYWWEPSEELCINADFIIATTYCLARAVTDEEFEALMKEDEDEEDEDDFEMEEEE